MIYIRRTQNILADTLSGMFKSSSPEVPNQVVCHLALTTFPLAFQELGQLQRKYSVLAYIIVELEIGDKFDTFRLKCLIKWFVI